MTEQPVQTDLGLTFDETALIRQIQTGKTALFAELIVRYQDRAYNLAYRLTGSPEDAADLSQETFTRAIRSIGQFRGSARFYTWLVRIMINITNDWKSKLKQERDFQQQMQDQLARSQAAEVLKVRDPQSQAQDQEMIERLWQAVGLMDLPSRQILLLRDLEQLSYEEIAQILKLSAGTVKSRIFRAREALRGLLAPAFNADPGSGP